MARKILTPQDLDRVTSLQNAVYNHLAQYSNPRFIIKRSDEYLAEHLKKPHAFVGYEANGQHVGQAIFRAPDPFDISELGLPHIIGVSKSDRMSILQGICVHPDFQGQGYMRTIMSDWMDWSRDQGIHNLAARTEVNHEASKRNFIKNDFEMVGTLVDPYDNATVCVFHRKLK